MKIKTIRKVISNKFDEWIESIKDEKVKELAKKNSLISGGCIASMLLQEDPHDFDIYFTNKETIIAVANYYAEICEGTVVITDELLQLPEINPTRIYYESKGFKDPGRIGIFLKEEATMQEMDDDDKDLSEKAEEDVGKYKILFVSTNAISLSDKIQLILRFYGTPKEIHSNYDYVHCTNYWLSEDRELVLNQDALVAILTKELRYIGSKYPIASILRTKKFLKRGFTINAGEYLKMCYQVSKLDLNDISTLEDQLVGVDVAYFVVLINALENARKKSLEEGKSFELTYPYLLELIDRIFN